MNLKKSLLIASLGICPLIGSAQEWKKNKQNSEFDFTDVRFLDQQRVIASFSSKGVLRSEDSGKTWQEIDQSFDATINQFCILDANTIIGAGIGKMITKSVDGGKTWQTKNYDSKDATVWVLYAVAFASPSIGCAAGGDGIILRTVNGGEKWKDVSPKNVKLSTINALIFFDENVGLACGIKGMARTNDGGKTWEQVEKAPGYPNNAGNKMTAIDENTAYLLNDREVWKTTDKGQNWTKVFSKGTSVRLVNLSFISTNEGYLTGEEGQIFYTKDGGTTWEDVVSPTKKSLEAITISKDGKAIAVGSGGMLISNF